MEQVYNIHTLSQDEKYKKVSEDIIGDMLMGLNKFTYSYLIQNLTTLQKNLIYDYYYLSNKFYNEYSHLYIVDYSTRSNEFIVYKGVYNTRIFSEIETFIVPFSTAIELNSVLHWTDDNRYIYHICITKTTKFLCIDNDNEGKEVVLPCGNLYKRYTYKKFIEGNYYTIIVCDFEETENLI